MVRPEFSLTPKPQVFYQAPWAWPPSPGRWRCEMDTCLSYDEENSASYNPNDCNLITPGDPEELFQIEMQLGEGSFGVVYKAKCTGDGLCVAVKALPIFENCMQSAAHELRILRDCQHPNVVGYYGYLWPFTLLCCGPYDVKYQGPGVRTTICG